MIRLYVDAACGKKSAGIGVKIQYGDFHFRIGAPCKPNCTTIEAEAYAILFGLDVVQSLKEDLLIPPDKNPEISIFTDSSSIINAVYGVTRIRSQRTKDLAKMIVERAEYLMACETFSSWKMQPIKTGENPADNVAKNTRHVWAERWKRKQEPRTSGRSS